MQAIVILWLTVFIVLLCLTIYNKDHTASTGATVLESNCVTVKDAHPCTVKVKYEVDGLQYVQHLGVSPSSDTLVGGKLRVRYNRLLPNQIREYRTYLNLFTIPTIAWFLLGVFIYSCFFLNRSSP